MFGHMIRHPDKYVKRGFCEVDKNKYLKDYIDTRNKLLDIKSVKGGVDTGIDKTLSNYRDREINHFCQELNINLKEGVKYDYSSRNKR
jgi:hypothetical protein